MAGISLANWWLAGTVMGGLLLIWPVPERRRARWYLRYTAILACGVYVISPAFPMTADRAGWPWCLIDDAIASVVLVGCLLAHNRLSESSNKDAEDALRQPNSGGGP